MSFSITNKSVNGFTKMIIKDESSGTFAEVIPSCGAILSSFTINCNGDNFNVIESYESAEDFKTNVTSKGFRGCKLSPFVCRLNKGKYQFNGRNYLAQKFFLNGHALHGLLYDQQFSVNDKNASEESAFVKMRYSYESADAGYPFNYDCVILYELEKENKLNVITEIINNSPEVIPIQDGWHPYFKLDSKVDELKLQLKSDKMVEFNSELLPTGNLTPYHAFVSAGSLGNISLDNCFTLNFSASQPLCVLSNKKKKIAVEIHPDKSYPYLQIYIPPHRNSISLENLSSPPDAFNNKMDLKILSPGESSFFKTSYKITLLT